METPKVEIPELKPAITPIPDFIKKQIPEIEQLYRALRLSDQLILLEIFTAVMEHKAAIAYAKNLRPMEALLLLALLEERRSSKRALGEMWTEVQELRRLVRELKDLTTDAKGAASTLR